MSLHLNLKIKQKFIWNIVDKFSSSEITHIIMNDLKKIMPKKITRCMIFLIFLLIHIFLFFFFKFDIILINFNI